MNKTRISLVCLFTSLLLICTITIQDVKADPPNRGVVSIAFDDNYDNQYDYAWPLMQSRGIHGTFYIRTGTMESAGYLTYYELQLLQGAGNEIASHSVTHRSFNELSDSEIRAECQNSKNTLASFGLSISNFAYPNGITTDYIDTIVDDYYDSARTAYIPPYIISNPSIQFRLPGFSSEDEPNELDSLKNFIDQIYSSNSWGIILFHNIIPNDQISPYTTSQEDFEDFLDYTISKGVRTLTVDQTLNTMVPITITANHGTATPPSGLYELGSTIDIEAFAPVSGAGERFVWGGWSGSGLGSYSGTNNPATITINGPITQNAIWNHEYLLTISSNYGDISPSNGAYWYEAGSTIDIEAFAPVSGAGERFVWGGWSGSGLGSYSGTNNPVTITMNQAITEIATWKKQFSIILEQNGVGSDFSGNMISIDGISYPRDTILWLDSGSHSFSFMQNLFVSENKKYVWVSSSGFANQASGSFIITGSGSIISNYKIQYYVEVISLKGITTGQGWYDVGSTVFATLDTDIVNLSEKERYFFSGWTGDASGFDITSHSIIVNNPLTLIADWKKQYLVTLNQTGIPQTTEVKIKLNSNDYTLPLNEWFEENSQIAIEYPESITIGFITTYALNASINEPNLIINSPINLLGIYQVTSNNTLLMAGITGVIIILLISFFLFKKKNII